MATEGGGETYAGRVGKGTKKKKKLNILDILLERKDNSISYNLSKDELSKLLFKKMKLNPKSIVKIDSSAFRTIHVELTHSIEPESYSDLPSFEIRDGLRTKFSRPHHRKETLVTISWLDLETPDELIFHVFSHFGTMKSNIQLCKIREENEESEEAKLLNDIFSGERQFWIEIEKPLPSYASIDGRKVKLFHPGQKRTCARCQKDGENCQGRANAKLCEENGGEKIPVENVWKDILSKIGYKEWTGGDVSTDIAETDDHLEGGKEQLPPIEGCTGLILENLEENMNLEDVKSILKKACSNEVLESCTLHPTGSLKSKIVKDIDTSLIPAIAKKVDKISFKGRMIFCKPFVPKTPPKEQKTVGNDNLPIDNDHPSTKNINLDNQSTGKKTQESEHTPSRNEKQTTEDEHPENRNTNVQCETGAITKQLIPGLPEENRVKAKKTKEKKGKKTKEERKSSKEKLDPKKLTHKDFLINTKQATSTAEEDKTKEFEFSDGNVSDAAFEDSKEELVDGNSFSTPLTFKSSFARNVNLSEPRFRSRSVSLKRVFSSPDVDDVQKKKSMKSGIPAFRKNSGNFPEVALIIK